jgi:hypothetical protein
METGRTNILIATMMLGVILLVWNRSTQAALETIEQSYELTANLVERWPIGDDAHIVLRRCGGCEPVMLRVDAATRYGRSLLGRDITRDELLRLKATLRDADKTFVYVFYRPDDGTVTYFVLDVGK